MNFLVSHIVARIIFGLVAVACFVAATLLIRSAYRMSKKARTTGRLPNNIVNYADSDSQPVYRMIEQRRGTLRGTGLDRVIFKSALLDRYLGAVLLIVAGVFSAAVVIRDLVNY